MKGGRRIPLLAELVLFFLATPLLLWWLRASGRSVPVVPILLSVGVVVTIYLLRASPAQLRATLAAPVRRGELARVGLQLVAGAALLAALVLAVYPERFLDLPRQNPATWALLLGLYPALSVLPQELLFRAFFFERYAALWSGTAARVSASALSFGLAHAFYGSLVTVALAVLGGVLFAWTFARTGSLLLVVLEHSLYGLLLFTLGLGRLFHAGPW